MPAPSQRAPLAKPGTLQFNREVGTIGNALRCALRINSGKNIYNFGIAERLRALRYPIFTGGVVEGNGICSAAFCESAALRASACSPERADFPRPGEDVTAGDKKGNLARERLRG